MQFVKSRIREFTKVVKLSWIREFADSRIRESCELSRIVRIREFTDSQILQLCEVGGSRIGDVELNFLESWGQQSTLDPGRIRDPGIMNSCQILGRSGARNGDPGAYFPGRKVGSWGSQFGHNDMVTFGGLQGGVPGVSWGGGKRCLGESPKWSKR
jgi:hypothetical protein